MLLEVNSFIHEGSLILEQLYVILEKVSYTCDITLLAVGIEQDEFIIGMALRAHDFERFFIFLQPSK